MIPVQNPTYMLAPNWTFRPGGAIAIGNIIADPFKPHIVLSKASQEWLPPIATTIERDWKLALGNDRQATVALWASFLECVGLGLDGEHNGNMNVEYATGTLETIHFTETLTTRDIDDRVRDPIVAALMRPDRSFLSKPVYMITGMKIAKDFQLTSEKASRKGVNVGITGPTDGLGGVTVGGQAAVAAGSSGTYSFSAENVVFAYQLHRIAPKGWRRQKIIQVTEFQPAAAFLTDRVDDSDEEAVEVEHHPFTASDLGDLDTKPAALREERLVDGESECVVLSLNTVNGVTSRIVK